MSATTSSSYPVSRGSAETEPAAFGVGTASSKLVDRKAGSPTGGWQRALHARESAFYTRYLEVEDVRRALAKRENYPHTPLS